MLPTVEKACAISISRGAKGARVSAHQTDDDVPWSRWQITLLPPEVLLHIFSRLDCDSVVQISNTCQLFRALVHVKHTAALLYSQFPPPFRTGFRQSRSWLKQMVKDGLHPFTTKVPVGESKLVNAEQQAAELCFHTLGKMMSTSGYFPRKVFAGSFWYTSVGILHAPTSSHFLIYFKHLAKVSLLSQNDAGAWSEQKIELDQRPGHSLSIRGSFSVNRRYFSVFGFSNLIQIYQRDSGTWELVNRQRIEMADWFRISPSGKYLVVSNGPDGIESIRCFDEQALWHPMPLAIEINNRVKWVEFSSSEQHLFIRCKKKLVILSLDSRGCWNLTWETTSSPYMVDVHVRFSPSEELVALRCKRKVLVLSLGSRGRWSLAWENPSNLGFRYAEFCPSGSWLLIGYRATEPCGGFVEMIKLDPAGKCLSRQIISSQNLTLTFSPGGNFLFSGGETEQYLLWGLLKSDQWVLYGELDDSRALCPGVGRSKLKLNIMVFSPCDNYLFTSSWDGVVKIWRPDAQGNWLVWGCKQCDIPVHSVKFSRSGVHALVVDKLTVRIWGRDDGGLWSVKGIIPATGARVFEAYFHPVAEHLIVLWAYSRIRIWEIGTEPVEDAVAGNHFLMR